MFQAFEGAVPCCVFLVTSLIRIIASPCPCMYLLTDRRLGLPPLRSQLLDSKRGPKPLCTRAARVTQVRSVNPITMRGVANAIAIRTDVQRLGHPIARNASAAESGQSVDVLGRGPTLSIDIACESTLVGWVAKQYNRPDGSECIASQLGHGACRRGCSLAIAFEDETLIGRGSERGGDFVDNVSSSGCRVLAGAGCVYGVIDCAAGDLGGDLGVHGSETR